jgi:hypothetical protein
VLKLPVGWAAPAILPMTLPPETPMSRSILGLVSLTLALALAAPARADDDCNCPGTPGYVLNMPASVGIGENFTTCLEAPGGSVALILISDNSGPLNTKFGTLCVGFPFLTYWVVAIPPSGELCLDHTVECDHSVVGFTGHFQFAAFGPNPGEVGLSNSQCLTATNSGTCDIHSGDFVSYTQGAWGAKCNGNNPACTRDANFPSVFPFGLIAGDPDGDDADGIFALVLQTSQAVEDFLPDSGPAQALAGDEVNVANSSAGVIAGQLVAAMITVGFDDAGVFDGQKAVNFKIGDLVFASGVASPLIGMSVRDLIDLANQAISGAILPPFDVDGDFIGDVSFSDLNDALTVVNENFDNGNINNGHLAYP